MNSFLKHALAGGLLVSLCSFNAAAFVSIDPGATHVFSAPDAGETECHIETLVVNCNPAVPNRFSGTGYDVATRELRAVVDPLVGTFAEANHASASLYNDFTVTGTGGVVPAYVSVGFNFTATLVGAAAYTVDGALNLLVSDVTGGAPGMPVASTTLVSQERSGDQGVTDISVGGQHLVLTGEGGGLKVLLTRGRTYRVSVQATAYGAALLLGDPSVDLTATLNSLHVTVDEDEVEQLAVHDAEIKADLAAHDADISADLAAHDAAVQAQIAQHDADIKALLTGIKDDLEEIKLLLITPQGLRPGFPNNPNSGGGSSATSTTTTSQTTSVQAQPAPAGPVTNSRRWRRLFR